MQNASMIVYVQNAVTYIKCALRQIASMIVYVQNAVTYMKWELRQNVPQIFFILVDTAKCISKTGSNATFFIVVTDTFLKL
jgi:hypothetical protein